MKLEGKLGHYVLSQRGQVVRQDKGVLYSGWEAHMAKPNKQPLASLEPFGVTQRVKCRQVN
jgi:hypothetical protein